MKQLKLMHYIVYFIKDQKSRNLMYVIPSFAHLSPVLPGWFKPSLTHCAGQNHLPGLNANPVMNFHYSYDMKN